MRLQLLSILLLLFHSQLEAQYPSIRDSSDADIINFFKQKNDQQLEVLSASHEKNKSDLKTAYIKRLDEQKYLLEHGRLLIHTPIQSRLDSLLYTIEEKNNLDHNRRVFLVADLIPNAYTTGDGCIFINIGLMERLHNFDELAFVVCHEISHELKNHVNEKIKIGVQMQNDKQFARELKNLSKEEFGTRSKLEKKINSRMSGMLIMSRSNEIEADSMGQYLYFKCGFHQRHVFQVMKILQSADKPIDPRSIDWPKYALESNVKLGPGYIIEKTVSSLGFTKYEVKEVPDSLRTHPDIPIRIKELEFNATDTLEQPVMDSSYEEIRRIASDEMIFTWGEIGNWGRVLYLSAISNMTKESAYSRIMMSISFSKLSIAHKRRVLGEILSLENIEFDFGYNQTLHLAHEMTIEEKALFSKGLLNHESLKNVESDFLLYAKFLSAYASNDEKSALQYANRLIKQYPQSRFYTSVLFIYYSK